MKRNIWVIPFLVGVTNAQIIGRFGLCGDYWIGYYMITYPTSVEVCEAPTHIIVEDVSCSSPLVAGGSPVVNPEFEET